MLGFFVRRVGLLIPTFIGVSFVAFAFVRVLPGDPVLLLAGEHGLQPERYAELLHQYGFDLPIWQQYLIYLGQLIHGNFGISIVTKRPVMSEFFTLFPATLELSTCAIILAVVVGVPAGVVAAVRRGKTIDHVTMGGGAGRLFDADLLVGAAAHHRLFRLAALDAGLGAHLAHLFLQAGHRLHADRQPALRTEGRLPVGGVAI